MHVGMLHQKETSTPKIHRTSAGASSSVPIDISGGRTDCTETLKKARMVHFIEAGDDTFYIAGYAKKGLECGGYNVVRNRLSRIVTRVLSSADYPQMLPTDFFSWD